MYHIQYLLYSLRLQYSASTVEVDTQCWNFELQLVGESPIVITNPVVDFHVFMSPT